MYQTKPAFLRSLSALEHSSFTKLFQTAKATLPLGKRVIWIDSSNKVNTSLPAQVLQKTAWFGPSLEGDIQNSLKERAIATINNLQKDNKDCSSVIAWTCVAQEKFANEIYENGGFQAERLLRIEE